MDYTVKVWLFTVIVSPFVLLITLAIFVNPRGANFILESWQMACIMMLFGLFLSIPAMILFEIIQRQLIKKCSRNKVKLSLSVYSFTSVWITFYILDRGIINSGSSQIFWVIAYSLTIVLGVWIFNYTKKSII